MVVSLRQYAARTVSVTNFFVVRTSIAQPITSQEYKFLRADKSSQPSLVGTGWPRAMQVIKTLNATVRYMTLTAHSEFGILKSLQILNVNDVYAIQLRLDFFNLDPNRKETL